MYVLPSDGQDRALDTNGTLANSVASFQSWLAQEASGRSVRLDTFQGALDITFYRLPETDAAIASYGVYERDRIEADLHAAGFNDPAKIYPVYYDGSNPRTCGDGSWPPALIGNVVALYLHGAPPGAPSCDTNPFAAAGAPPGYLDFAMLHEIFHALGVVPTCAPHSTSNGHVTDSPTDLMYAGSQPWQPSVLDYGHDDYFMTGINGCLDVSANSFLSSPAGRLRVTTSPPEPGQILVNGQPYDSWGLAWVKLPPGSYTLSFTDVPGYSTPAPVTATVNSGADTTVAGAYVQRGLLRVTTSPALPAAPTILIDGIPRDDWGVWTFLPTGSHQICFDKVVGYNPPACATVDLTVAGATVNGAYVINPAAPGPSNFGYLRVTTSPAVPSQISVNGVPHDSWALSKVKLSPGSYSVSFSDVPGYATPVPQTVTVSNGALTSATGTFTKRGLLRVLTSPAVPATIFIDGTPREDWGLWSFFPVGSHSVCFGWVAGYKRPSCQAINLTTGGATITGMFTAATSARP